MKTGAEIWNSLTPIEKKKITSQAHGTDTTKKMINADIDCLSPYSCLSEKTRKLLEEKITKPNKQTF